MNISSRKLIAAGATALLVGASTILIAAPASAADFYVDDSQLTTPEVSPYPAGWFQGTVTTPGGSYTSGLSGLEVTGAIQVLNGIESTWPAGTGLDPALPGFAAPGITLATGAASFQIPVFTTPSTGPALPGYTTLYADAAGIASDTWFTNWAIGGGAGAGGFDAGDSATLSALVAVMDPDYQVLAFGFNVVDADSATVVSLEWAGDTYWFLPAAPTATVTPTSLTESEFATSGVTATFTGYVPGEDVNVSLSTSGSGGLAGTVVADINGVVAFTLPASALSPEVYTLTATGATSDVVSSAAFTVTADAAAMPATGADAAGPLALGGTLLLAGLAFVLVTRARRKRGAATA